MNSVFKTMPTPDGVTASFAVETGLMSDSVSDAVEVAYPVRGYQETDFTDFKCSPYHEVTKSHTYACL
jgi:hypothetical protein